MNFTSIWQNFLPPSTPLPFLFVNINFGKILVWKRVTEMKHLSSHQCSRKVFTCVEKVYFYSDGLIGNRFSDSRFFGKSLTFFGQIWCFFKVPQHLRHTQLWKMQNLAKFIKSNRGNKKIKFETPNSKRSCITVILDYLNHFLIQNLKQQKLSMNAHFA